MEAAAGLTRAGGSVESWRAQAWRGALAVAPLWPGVVAFGAAFALVARAGGFGAPETLACSLLVFAGSAQLAAVSLAGGGAGALAILTTVLVLNLRHVLYALSLHRLLPAHTRLPRPLLAFFLTDEAYGFAVRHAAERRDRGHAAIEAYYVGVALSLYVVFGSATLAGLLFGSLLPDPQRIALGFIFPLTFLALLVPLVRSGRALLVAGVAGAVALGLSSLVGSGETIVGATVAAAALGAALDLRAARAA